MRNGALASLLVVAILVGAGAGYIIGTANQRSAVSSTTVVSTTTNTQTLTMQSPYAECGFTTSCSVTNPSGIVLTMELNTTFVRPNGSLSVTVNELNPTTHDINMSAADNWFLSDLPSLWICYTGSPPYGIDIFRGYYTIQNVSMARNIINLSEYVLPALCIYSQAVTGFTFKAGSSFVPRGGFIVANGLGRYQFGATNGKLARLNFTYGEYSLWSSEPAVYTIAVGDEWGDLALAHFTVTANLTYSSASSSHS